MLIAVQQQRPAAATLIVRINGTHRVRGSGRQRFGWNGSGGACFGGARHVHGEIIRRIIPDRYDFGLRSRLSVLALLPIVQLLLALARLEKERVQIVDTMHERAEQRAHAFVDLDEADGRRELTREAERDELELIEREENDHDHGERVDDDQDGEPIVKPRREHHIHEPNLFAEWFLSIVDVELVDVGDKVTIERVNEYSRAHDRAN